MADIGEPVREVEWIPIPETVPAPEEALVAVPQAPAREPQPQQNRMRRLATTRLDTAPELPAPQQSKRPADLQFLRAAPPPFKPAASAPQSMGSAVQQRSAAGLYRCRIGR
ncbi:hypothetical protein [Kitasatospora sp. P5_F3]